MSSPRFDLFRFTTVRPVQTLDPLEKMLFFVHHPAPENSKLLTGLAKLSLVRARAEIRKRGRYNQPAVDLNALPGKHKELYRLGLWLNRHRTTAEESSIKDRVAQAQPLADESRRQIWDALLYGFLSGSHPTRRQHATLLLVTDHIIRTLREEKVEALADELWGRTDQATRRRFLGRLLRTKVVLPRYLSRDPQEEEPAPGPSDDGSVKIEKPDRAPADLHLLRLENDYVRAKGQYAALSTVQGEWRKSRAEVWDYRQKSVAALLKVDPPLSPAIINYLSHLSDKSQTVNDAYKALNQAMLKANSRQRDLIAQVRDRSTAAIPDYAHRVDFDPTEKGGPLIITLKSPSSDVRVSKSNLRILEKDQVVADGVDLKRTGENNWMPSYLALADSDVNLATRENYRLQGTVDMTDGTSVDIDLPFSATRPNAEGFPKTDPKPGPLPDQHDFPGPVLYGVQNIGMGIFRRVEQEICCYLPGEVSHIENIMAREYKERSTRRVELTETTDTLTNTQSNERSSDTATTVRSELQQAINEVLNKGDNFNVNGGTSVTGNLGPGGEIQADASIGFAMNNAATISDTEAKNFAEDITRAAAERVASQIVSSQSVVIRNEFEENIRHGYDNRQGNEHVTGIYRWVDIVYKNRLVNYGNMEMIEFLIPEPARFYRDTILGTNKPKGDGGEPPTPEPEGIVSLADLGIKSPSDIAAYATEPYFVDPETNVGNRYQELMAYYGITVSGPPAELDMIPVVVPGNGLDHKTPDSKSRSGYVPDTHRIVEIAYSGHFYYNPGDKGKNPVYITIVTAGKRYHWTTDPGDKGSKEFKHTIGRVDQEYLDELKQRYEDASTPESFRVYPKLSVFEVDEYVNGNVTSQVSYDRGVSFEVTVELHTRVTDEYLLDWKTDVFQQLDDAFAASQATDDPFAGQEPEEKEPDLAKLATGNTAMNRRVEIRELKRAAIEMLTRPFNKLIGINFLDDGICGTNFPRQGKLWQLYSSHVKFLEQAFHWEIMAYRFYAYYWASRCRWDELMRTEDPTDQIFESFLQSGMARMIVPVRKGFEGAVNLYLQTGEIWNGEDVVLDTEDDLYLSIDQELESPPTEVEKEWQTRLPSQLTLIQADSAYLAGEGLPCCEEHEKEEKPIEKSTALLGVVLDQEVP